MAQDVQVGLLALDYPVRVIDLFGQADRVYLAADSRDFAGILTAIRILVSEVDGAVAGPLRVRRIGIRDPVPPVVPVAIHAGERKAPEVYWYVSFGPFLKPKYGGE